MAAIYLIRHGQANWGVGDYDKLSESRASVSRARWASHCVNGSEIVDLAVVGEMRRHRETAAHAMAGMGPEAARAETRTRRLE